MFDIVTDIPQPKDREIMFKDIITDGRVERVKSNALLEGDYKQFIKDEIKQDAYLKSRINKGKQPPNLVYVDTDKHTCLNTASGANRGQESLKHRNETTGMITLVYVDTDKHVSVKTNQCHSNTQEYLRHRNETTGMITLIHKDGIVRTVNQIEMERLQGFPDGYTSILSKAKAGSLLGDGWTLPIIEHIFSFIVLD